MVILAMPDIELSTRSGTMCLSTSFDDRPGGVNEMERTEYVFVLSSVGIASGMK